MSSRPVPFVISSEVEKSGCLDWLLGLAAWIGCLDWLLGLVAWTGGMTMGSWTGGPLCYFAMIAVISSEVEKSDIPTKPPVISTCPFVISSFPLVISSEAEKSA